MPDKPFPIYRRAGDRKSANLYIRKKISAAAIDLAESRYGVSLSTLVDNFLEYEITHKRGMFERKRGAR